MYTIIDLETTGLDREQDQIIQVGAVKLDESFNQIGSLSLNVKLMPGNVLRPFITELTGITEADLDNAVPAWKAYGLLEDFIGSDVFVAQFASFDLGFLPLGDNVDFYCTKSVFNLLHPGRKASLTNIVDFYELEHLKHHTALDDCFMTAQVFQEQLKEIKERAKDVTEFVNVMTMQQDRPIKFIPSRAVIKYQ